MQCTQLLKILRFVHVLLALLIGGFFSSLGAATLVVSPSGSDSGTGPFRTIQYAYSKATSGDLILVKPGIYTDYKPNYGLHLDKNGITLRSEVRGQAILDGQNKTDRPEGIYITGSGNIVDGFQIKNGFKGGIKIYGSSSQILYNEIHHNGNTGDPASSFGQDGIFSDKSSRGTIYLANLIHHNGRIAQNSNLDHGMYLCGQSELIANNIVTYNSAYGINMAGYVAISGTRVINNTSAFNGRSGMLIWQNFSGIQFKNNISYRNKNYGFDTWDAHGSGVLLDSNIYFGNGMGAKNMSGGGSNVSYTSVREMLIDPLFSEEVTFNLKASSPAIGAGVPTEVTTDYSGRPRANPPSVGAQEGYGGSQTPPPPATNLDVTEIQPSPDHSQPSGPSTSQVAVPFLIAGVIGAALLLGD